MSTNMQALIEQHAARREQLSRHRPEVLHAMAERELRIAFHAQFDDPARWRDHMLGCALACLIAVEVADGN